jgi:hypothetical protein
MLKKILEEEKVRMKQKINQLKYKLGIVPKEQVPRSGHFFPYSYPPQFHSPFEIWASSFVLSMVRPERRKKEGEEQQESRRITSIKKWEGLGNGIGAKRGSKTTFPGTALEEEEGRTVGGGFNAIDVDDFQSNRIFCSS